MSLSKQLVTQIVELYDTVFDEGYDCEYCDYKKLVREPHGEVTRHCSVENYIDECPVIENVILESRVGGTKKLLFNNNIGDRYVRSNSR